MAIRGAEYAVSRVVAILQANLAAELDLIHRGPFFHGELNDYSGSGLRSHGLGKDGHEKIEGIESALQFQKPSFGERFSEVGFHDGKQVRFRYG